MYVNPSQRLFRRLSHVHCMEDGRLPNTDLHSKLAAGTIFDGRPLLSFMNVCRKDMKPADMEGGDR